MKLRLKFTTELADPVTELRTSVRSKIDSSGLNTVCEESMCPNLSHCWGRGTATFLVMGNTCTRNCGFCNIGTGRPSPLDPTEPGRLAETVQKMNLTHAVITSVDRDELPDCGSTHFAACIKETKLLNPKTTVEVLMPDFKAVPESLQRIFDEKPHIISHNIETVPSLFKTICPQSNYMNSLEVLERSAKAGFLTKTGLILGLGETIDEVKQVIVDAKRRGVKLLTIGQYLQPTHNHAPLIAYIAPEVFANLKTFAMNTGYLYVESGPMVRSSYHAGDALDFLLKNEQQNVDTSSVS